MDCHSEDLAEIGAAMALAQAEIEGASKDADNPFFKSKYATLASVWEACKPALTKHGLSVLQFSEPSERGTLALVTMLLHKSGQFISGTETLPLAKDDPQGYGSAITYARRYGLAAMVGVCPEDDDAQAAMAPKPAPRARTAPPAVLRQAVGTSLPVQPSYGEQTPAGCTPEARNWFFGVLKGDLGIDHTEAVRLLGVTSLKEDMGDKSFSQILSWTKMAQLKEKEPAQQPALVD